MIKRTLLVFVLLAAVAAAQPRHTASFDVVIRHGTILDGSGGSRYDADVGVRGGRIVAIGDLAAAKGAVELDARGLFVAPGLHQHPRAPVARRAADGRQHADARGDDRDHQS